MNPDQHAPTPQLTYSISEQYGKLLQTAYLFRAGDESGPPVATMQGVNVYGLEREAKAIVRACNSHAQLVAALEQIARLETGDEMEERGSIMENDDAYTTLNLLIESARAALTAAKE